MKRQAFLGLTAKINYAFGVKLEPENKLKVCFEFCFRKRLEKAIE
jgi:hypothetical protein